MKIALYRHYRALSTASLSHSLHSLCIRASCQGDLSIRVQFVVQHNSNYIGGASKRCFLNLGGCIFLLRCEPYCRNIVQGSVADCK